MGFRDSLAKYAAIGNMPVAGTEARNFNAGYSFVDATSFKDIGANTLDKLLAQRIK